MIDQMIKDLHMTKSLPPFTYCGKRITTNDSGIYVTQVLATESTELLDLKHETREGV